MQTKVEVVLLLRLTILRRWWGHFLWRSFSFFPSPLTSLNTYLHVLTLELQRKRKYMWKEQNTVTERMSFLCKLPISIYSCKRQIVLELEESQLIINCTNIFFNILIMLEKETLGLQVEPSTHSFWEKLLKLYPCDEWVWGMETSSLMVIPQFLPLTVSPNADRVGSTGKHTIWKLERAQKAKPCSLACWTYRLHSAKQGMGRE